MARQAIIHHFPKNKKITSYPLYFAYGSNLNLSQMEVRCPGARLVRPYVLEDWRLVFRSVADIEPAKGCKVAGALFKISLADEKALDRYEGFPRLYEKIYWKLSSYVEDAMAYRMTNGHRGRYAPPDLSYLQTILHGYHQVGISESHLEAAIQYTDAKIDARETEQSALLFS